jgi:hypothetical protein
VEFDDKESIDGKRSLRIEPKGEIDWQFIVLNLPIIVNKGKTYTTSFWAKAQKDRPIAAKLKATDNTIDFCLTNLGPITNEWKEFSFTCEPLVDSIKLEMFCAASDVIFWLDFVSLYQGKPVDDNLPSKFRPPESVNPVSKLAVEWASIKSAI